MRKHLSVTAVISGICVIYIVLSVIVFSFSASYTVPLGDDLFTEPFVAATPWSLVAASFRHAFDSYRYWVGTFFSFFLSYLLSPFHGSSVPPGAGNLTKLRIVMFFNAFLFFLALLCLVYVVLRRVAPKRNRLFIFVSTAVLFGFLNLQSYAEVFFWLTPAAVYSMPAISALLSLSLAVISRTDSRKRFLIPSAVLAFLSGGGVLMIAGALCYILLVITAYDRFKTGHLNKRLLIVFGAAFASALINTLAPGNFVRSDAIGTSVNPVRAAASAVWFSILELESLFSGTVLLPVLMAALILGFLFFTENNRAQLRDQLVLTALLLPAPLVAMFPLQLGNGGIGMAVRGQFVFDLAAFLPLFALFFLGGQYLASRLTSVRKEPALLMLSLLLLCILSFDGVTVMSLPQYGMARNLAGGHYRAYHARIGELFLELENSSDPDVVIELPEELREYQNFLLSTDPADYINHGLAVAFGKDSIRAAE